MFIEFVQWIYRMFPETFEEVLLTMWVRLVLRLTQYSYRICIHLLSKYRIHDLHTIKWRNWKNIL